MTLDTLVTVVDTSSFQDHLDSSACATEVAVGAQSDLGADPADQRPLAELLAEQVGHRC